MQFSESWLRQLCNPPLDTEALSHALTMAGLEVEELHPVAPRFEKIVVAQVLSAEKHPGADKLKLCSVDIGQPEPLQIVCGAPNVAPGLRVPCALVGAVLPGIEIRQAKVRGIDSFGMLCSAKELGISEEASGLLVLPDTAPVGQPLRSYLDLDDQLITLKLTPNRADCLSLSGIAREVAALTGASLMAVESPPVSPTVSDTREVRLDAPRACPRYCGRIVRGVDAAAATPEWMRRRLERSGLRSISAIVDITNYVMLELGQPLHAFDNGFLSGAIRVRYPVPGERLTLLNGQVIEPSPDNLLIADDRQAVALAGIMGGEASGVTTATQDIFLESAFFAPDAIAGKARALGFSSDASYRFERGVDPEGTRRALERATALVLDICGGQSGPVTEAVIADDMPRRPAVSLRFSQVARLIGVTIDRDTVERMLSSLGFALQVTETGWAVTPPAYRFDVTIEEDLIEEIARLFGYDNIPANPPQGRVAMLPLPEARHGAMAVRRRAAALGYREVVNFSFVEAGWEADFADNTAPIVLANPIASQMGVMRTTLIGGLVDTLSTNRKRQLDRVRLFEVGRCFLQGHSPSAVVEGFDQPLRLAALASGSCDPEQWGSDARSVDFFDLKGDIEALFEGRRLQFEKTTHPALHPGRSACVLLDGQPVGIVGELHPRWVQKYELGGTPVVFELELAALANVPMPRYREVSRFPAVVRDLAVLVDRGLPWEALRQTLAEAAPSVVTGIELFDIYQGKGVPEDRKSLAFRVVMQDTERTLADADVDAAMSVLLTAAESRHGAELRR